MVNVSALKCSFILLNCCKNLYHFGLYIDIITPKVLIYNKIIINILGRYIF